MTGSEEEVLLTSTGAPDVAAFEQQGRQALLELIRETADKLERDQATRGDLKIVARAMRELRYAFKVFGKYRTTPIVSLFGSARTPAGHPEFQAAEEFGRRMAADGWMVLTGAGPGVMEAAHRGAGREKSLGVNILLPFEQSAHPSIEGDPKLVTFRYFFTRKLMFVKDVRAFVAFPGGFGTLDELFEVLTLVQTGKRDLLPIVLIDEPQGTYWSDWLKFISHQLGDRRFISVEDLSLFRVTNSLEQAIDEIQTFYRVYHSSRFVRGRLVMRLKKSLSPETLKKLSSDFREILTGGEIEAVGPHAYEADEPEVWDLPRIQMSFNRRDMGRLRQFVDALNRR